MGVICVPCNGWARVDIKLDVFGGIIYVHYLLEVQIDPATI
jgi:hypothetical protein